MEPEWLEVVLLFVVWLVVAGLICCAPVGRALIRVGEFLVAHAPRRERPRPANRPIEEVAADARRLGWRFHHPPRGVSFARFEGTRWAYDKVLAEACRALDITHLLAVLEPGPELDAERRRVERVLGAAGLEVDQAA